VGSAAEDVIGMVGTVMVVPLVGSGKVMLAVGRVGMEREGRRGVMSVGKRPSCGRGFGTAAARAAPRRRSGMRMLEPGSGRR
jgi:hypothetical protein